MANIRASEDGKEENRDYDARVGWVEEEIRTGPSFPHPLPGTCTQSFQGSWSELEESFPLFLTIMAPYTKAMSRLLGPYSDVGSNLK